MRLSSFITRRDAAVVALIGGWGCGKTHAWRESIKRHIDEFRKTDVRYAYVSLFGVKTVAELKTAIFMNTEKASEAHREATWSDINQRWRTLAPAKARSAFKKFRSVADVNPIAKGVALTVDAIAQTSSDGLLICLDDIERSGMSMSDLLGIVSDLRESHECKVILIFNHEKLDKDAGGLYRQFREKVIDEEIVHFVTPDEVAALAVPPEAPWRATAVAMTRKLRLTNIRIARRANNICQSVEEMVDPYGPQIGERVYEAVFILTAIRYTSPDDVLSDVGKWTTWLYKPPVEENTRFAVAREFIQRAEIQGLEDFWPELARIVDQGFVDSRRLSEFLPPLQRKYEAQGADNAFTEAWESFHDRLNVREEEFVDKLFNAAKAAASSSVSMGNLDSTIVLLRELDRNALADELIDTYITANASTVDSLDVQKTENFFRRPIEDFRFREELKKAHHSATPTFDLREALIIFDSSAYHDQRVVSALRSASEEDFYHFIDSITGNSLRTAINMYINQPDEPGLGESKSRAISALHRIGRRSRLNALQLRKYGITVQALATEPGEKCPP